MPGFTRKDLESIFARYFVQKVSENKAYHILGCAIFTPAYIIFYTVAKLTSKSIIGLFIL